MATQEELRKRLEELSEQSKKTDEETARLFRRADRLLERLREVDAPRRRGWR